MTRTHRLSCVDKVIYSVTNAMSTKVGIVCFMSFVAMALYKESDTEKMAKRIKRKKTKGINIPKTISAPKLYTSAKSLHQIKNGSKIMKARENNVLTRKCFFMSLPP